MVLIETLWNVKKDIYDRLVYGHWVLIETLWNVKQSQDLQNSSSSAVLIETLWNVKVENVEPLITVFSY